MHNVSLTIWSNYFEVAADALKSGHLYTAETMFAAALYEAESFDLCALQQAASLHGLACAYIKSGRKAAAEVMLRKAFRIICDTDQISINDLRNIACLLADCYLETGDVAKAMPVLKAAAGQISRRFGDDVSALAPLFKRMAHIYSNFQRHAKAEMYFARAKRVESVAP